MKPYIILKAAQSLDGRLDDISPQRLLLSSPEDRERVDRLRAEHDAIMIGANTMRLDNPRLIINDEKLRKQRVEAGKPEHLLKVTLSGSGNLDPELKWFHHGGEKLVYTTEAVAPDLQRRLGDLAETVGVGSEVSLTAVVEDLGKRGVSSLLVEGGETIHTQFLVEELADEIQLVIAPLLVGDGPRFVSSASFPWSTVHRHELLEVRQVGDVALVRVGLDYTTGHELNG